MSPDETGFFRRPLFWRNLGMALAYPFMLVRYWARCRRFLRLTEKWRLLAFSVVPAKEMSPTGVESITLTEKETRIEDVAS